MNIRVVLVVSGGRRRHGDIIYHLQHCNEVATWDRVGFVCDLDFVFSEKHDVAGGDLGVCIFHFWP